MTRNFKPTSVADVESSEDAKCFAGTIEPQEAILGYGSVDIVTHRQELILSMAESAPHSPTARNDPGIARSQSDIKPNRGGH